MCINKRYRLKMETITPLHIGAAREKHLIKGLDYIYDRNRKEILFIDQSQLFRNHPNVVNMLLNANINEIQNIVFRNQYLIRRSVPLYNDPGENIRTHIKNGLSGNPIVPGSSIKGALRSILFKYLRQDNQTTNEEVFGRLNDGNDFMRFIRVTDAEFEETSYVTAKIYNLRLNNNKEWEGGWKHGLNNTSKDFNLTHFTTTFEVISSDKTAYFDLMVSPALFDLFYKYNAQAMNDPKYIEKKKLLHADSPIDLLFNIINNHTREYLNAELVFFEEYRQGENAEDIIAQINDYLLPFLDIKKSCLLRMASGSGFHAVTGNWQFPSDHIITIQKPIRGQKYKSRRIAVETTNQGDYIFLPMGFVLISYN